MDATDTELLNDLKHEFGSQLDGNEALQACYDICNTFKLSAESLRYKWEAMCYNSSRKTVSNSLNLENARDLRAHINREVTAAADLAAKRARIARTTGPRTGRLFSGTSFGTPTVKREAPERDIPDQLAASTTFETNSNRTKCYRYMYEKISERSDVLDTRIDKLAELVKQHFHLDDLADPASVTEDDVIVVGRIVCDSEAKLNEASMLIESSRLYGSGFRTPFKFHASFKSSSGTVTLYPGMVLAARGRNGGGGCFVATEILDLPLPPRVTSTGLSTPFEMVVASGPYTSNEGDPEHEFQFFKNILYHLKDRPPAVLVFIGPFLDATHPALREGHISKRPSQIFSDHIGKYLKPFSKRCPATRIIIIPSLRDILSTHCVFPQGPLDPMDLSLPPSVELLPNPAGFVVNGIRVAVSSVDSFLHLKKEELVKRTSASKDDWMERIARQLLAQRCLYPLFPVPRDLSSDAKINLDVTHMGQLEFDALFDGPDPAPDVLLLPSVVKHFHKTVEFAEVIGYPAFAKNNQNLITRLQFNPSTNIPRLVSFETVSNRSSSSAG